MTPSIYVSRSVGYVGIGTANPTTDLHVAGFVAATGASSGFRFGTATDGSTGQLAISGGSAYFHFPGTAHFCALSGSLAETLTLLSGGNVGIGTTNPAYNLDVSGTIRHIGIIVDVSDRRLKSNIRQLPTSLEAMLRLKPVSFTMNDNPGQTEYGFIAQDVQPLFPDLVITNNDASKTLSLNYTGFIAPMGRIEFPPAGRHDEVDSIHATCADLAR